MTNRRSFLKAGTAALAGLAGCGRKEDEQVSSPTGAAAPTERIPSTRPTPSETLFITPPAIFRPTASGWTLHWVSNGPIDARILIGPDPSRLSPVRKLSTSGPTTVVLDDQPADAALSLQCQFRRKGEQDWTARSTGLAHTARRPGATFRVALIADSHIYLAHKTRQHVRNIEETCKRVLRDRPDFVIFLGDEAGIRFRNDPPGFMSQQSAVQRWQLWRSAFAPVLAGIPTFMVLGNHEGESGYLQAYNLENKIHYYQRWGTVARKQYCLNPLPDSYPEGGESERWSGDPNSPALGGSEEGNCSPLQNYYAWTWGDALFVVLDVERYTNVGGTHPRKPEEWTLGAAQLQWMERVLAASSARWKILLAHHLVGGYAWDVLGKNAQTSYVYARGGARYARVGEQSRITDIMNRTGARLFLYGHDHVFAHQEAHGIHFVCNGRPTFLNPEWWSNPGWKEAYGDVAARNPHDFHAAVGYTRLTVAPDRLSVEYVRTGTDYHQAENVTAPEGEVVHAFTVT